MRRPVLIACAAAVVSVVMPLGLAGQMTAPRSTMPILVMEPIPGPSDTAYALGVVAAMRARMDQRYRFKMRVIPTEVICEAKEASGFTCDHIFSAANAAPLARFLQAQGYIVSWLDRGSDSVRLRARLVNNAGSGLSGFAFFAGAPNVGAEEFGRAVADQFERHLDAAERARDCDQARSQSNFRRARERARDAFAIIPNHPAAAMCLALLFEVQGGSADSIIWALQMAVEGDSANGSAWEMLGRRLFERGDTIPAIHAFVMQLEAEPGNIRLRTAIAGQMLTMGAYESADSLITPAIEFNPTDLSLLAIKEQACYEGENWGCALPVIEQTYELDTLRQQNLEFKFRAFSAAQSWEQTAPDSALPYLLRWSERIVQHDSTNVNAWRARSQAMQSAGDEAGTISAYRRILQIDPTQVSAAYAAAAILWDSTRLVIDTITPLDTARLFLGDSLWTRVTQLSTDTATWTAVAVQYYRIGIKMVPLNRRLDLAERYLLRALELDRAGVLTAPVNFYLGYSGFLQAGAMYQRVVAAQRCADIPGLEAHVRSTRSRLQAGRSVAQQVVDQRFFPFLTQIEGQFAALRANFCR
ncbi:MAG: hypothetical protein WD043_01360 [Gemmatimonadales bacterium]